MLTQVLVIEDDPGVRESLCIALKDEFEVSSVASAEEALQRFRNGPGPNVRAK